MTGELKVQVAPHLWQVLRAESSCHHLDSITPVLHGGPLNFPTAASSGLSALRPQPVPGYTGHTGHQAPGHSGHTGQQQDGLGGAGKSGLDLGTNRLNLATNILGLGGLGLGQ